MEVFGTLFEICMGILHIEIPIAGYQITLFNLLVYTVIAYLLLRLLFALFNRQGDD